MYKESTFITKLLKPYLKKHNWETSYIEAKVSSGNTLPFSKFQFHQIGILKKATKEMIAYKIPDVGMGMKPTDIIVTNKIKAYVAILFNKDQTPRKEFGLLSVEEVIKIKESGAKSIKKSDCITCYF